MPPWRVDGVNSARSTHADRKIERLAAWVDAAHLPAIQRTLRQKTFPKGWALGDQI